MKRSGGTRGNRTPVDAIRRFNRFYTRQIGALDEGLLRSNHSLTEVRVLYELAHRESVTAADLSRDLELDAGYLSRILERFRRRGLVSRQASAQDARRTLLQLTRSGREAFATLNTRADGEIAAWLQPLPPGEREQLVGAMKTIERILAPPSDPGAPFVLRPHRSGDLGWIVHRHGVLYAEEYGWNEEFEALVAGIAATFLREYDPRRDGSWIAERDGEFLGCVFLVRKSAGVAQLRMLLVEPRARGMGLGTRLVDECIRFATRAGYRRIVLWTYEALADARRIYERAGFRRVRTEKTHSFGHDGTAETWALTLPYRKRP